VNQNLSAYLTKKKKKKKNPDEERAIPLVQYNIRGPFAKFLDSIYYSESEFGVGEVTASFSKYLL
jgi:hypothetical protein